MDQKSNGHNFKKIIHLIHLNLLIDQKSHKKAFVTWDFFSF